MKPLLHAFFLDCMFIWCGQDGSDGGLGRSQLTTLLSSQTWSWSSLSISHPLPYPLSRNICPSFPIQPIPTFPGRGQSGQCPHPAPAPSNALLNSPAKCTCLLIIILSLCCSCLLDLCLGAGALPLIFVSLAEHRSLKIASAQEMLNKYPQ